MRLYFYTPEPMRRRSMRLIDDEVVAGLLAECCSGAALSWAVARELPLFSFANQAKGVIAIGNVAYGVVAFGGSISVGVISIGTNAVGVIALGFNAGGLISLSLINGAGVLAWAGINAIAGVGAGGVNTFTSPWLGAALAFVGLVVGLLIYVPRSRPTEADPALAGPLAGLLEAEPGVYRVAARLELAGRKVVLLDGEVQLEADADSSVLAGTDRRVLCDVRVIDEFDHRGDYRVAAGKHRRLVLQSVEEPPAPPRFLHAEGDLTWLFSRSLQVVSVVTGAICVATAMSG
jgi:hypothetical protein